MRTKKLSRTEMKETVIDLVDIGFTVGAVAYMLNKTPVSIYAHLKSVGRMKNRAVVRKKPKYIGPAANAAARKLYSGPAFWTTSETNGTSRGSVKRAA